MTIKAGDIVVLKSGGPRMTVQTVTGTTALCVWTEKNKTFREPFDLVLLRALKVAGPITFSF
uniref:YodC family protein n=1 Tax=uncultured Caulobacter sp. TaxID=158749 RepID=UPI00345B6EE7